MAEILAVGAVLVALVGAFFWLLQSLLRPTEAGRQDRAINANHHGLYLLVNDLVSAQDRGWTTVFPDQQTFDKARALLAGYEDQITALGVGLGPRAFPPPVEWQGVERVVERGKQAGPDPDD